MPRPTYPVTLINRHTLSSNTIQLDFQVDGEFDFIAGQFVQFMIDHDGKTHKRSYSIANSPEAFRADGHLEIAISLVKGGLASELFSQADLGLKLDMAGPFGILTAPADHSGQIVLAGTGTGLAPYRSMLPTLISMADNGIPVTVIMGVRHRSDLIYEQAFRDAAKQHSNLDYQVCISRETDVDENINEFNGYVQERFEHLNLDTGSDLVYLCGNPNMIDDAAKVLLDMGFGVRQVKREKYVYSGH
ncbi:hypothetical protein GZ77_11845 [Endozoicomonas montiporae]|uniref:FAD-binding FR-type domain-containing protein n=2 Tax=Endozoicomonas montiporae TaxID=1027273 RepID=A0A081N912_9GAMM|nr:FAD-binding oxidoreductase [Endozoicomonas montiporae]AMO55135.1 oxidoreductase FAD/NAD(P)-binding domain-containing protein [Endozoicomonas montiporae CL-33]KEQ14935.1 hypothetical protein GZ77_11845 [Endozoicomonas montiporae]